MRRSGGIGNIELLIVGNGWLEGVGNRTGVVRERIPVERLARGKRVLSMSELVGLKKVQIGTDREAWGRWVSWE